MVKIKTKIKGIFKHKDEDVAAENASLSQILECQKIIRDISAPVKERLLLVKDFRMIGSMSAEHIIYRVSSLMHVIDPKLRVHVLSKDDKTYELMALYTLSNGCCAPPSCLKHQAGLCAVLFEFAATAANGGVQCESIEQAREVLEKGYYEDKRSICGLGLVADKVFCVLDKTPFKHWAPQAERYISNHEILNFSRRKYDRDSDPLTFYFNEWFSHLGDLKGTVFEEKGLSPTGLIDAIAQDFEDMYLDEAKKAQKSNSYLTNVALLFTPLRLLQIAREFEVKYQEDFRFPLTIYTTVADFAMVATESLIPDVENNPLREDYTVAALDGIRRVLNRTSQNREKDLKQWLELPQNHNGILRSILSSPDGQDAMYRDINVGGGAEWVDVCDLVTAYNKALKEMLDKEELTIDSIKTRVQALLSSIWPVSSREEALRIMKRYIDVHVCTQLWAMIHLNKIGKKV